MKYLCSVYNSANKSVFEMWTEFIGKNEICKIFVFRYKGMRVLVLKFASIGTTEYEIIHEYNRKPFFLKCTNEQLIQKYCLKVVVLIA